MRHSVLVTTGQPSSLPESQNLSKRNLHSSVPQTASEMLTIRPVRSTPSITPRPQRTEESWLHFPNPEPSLRIPRTRRSPPSEACHLPGLRENRTHSSALVPGKPTGSLSPNVPFPLTHCRSLSAGHQNPSEPSLRPSWVRPAPDTEAGRGLERRGERRHTVTFSLLGRLLQVWAACRVCI